MTEMPVSKNDGVKISFIIEKIVWNSSQFGYDVMFGDFVNMMEKEITDPTKAVKICFLEAAEGGLSVIVRKSCSDRNHSRRERPVMGLIDGNGAGVGGDNALPPRTVLCPSQWTVTGK